MTKEQISELMQRYKPLAIRVRKALPLTTSAEQAGLVPMANPEVGAVAWSWARDRMRRGAIIAIGRKNATLFFTTDGAMKEAQRLYDLTQAADADQRAEVARAQESKRWQYSFEQSQRAITDATAEWEAENIRGHVRWIEERPNQAYYIEQEAEKRRAEIIASKKDPLESYVHCTRKTIPLDRPNEQAPDS
ncbi:hypothetical protein ABZ897_51190 [Nonomuraea sp. NPDC046802]|uniref:hypothetical protein n=1 Tax=Nonomuraea sp. NPDC046802 TaxID=3154919 RepID=UPI0033D1EBAA